MIKPRFLLAFPLLLCLVSICFVAIAMGREVQAANSFNWKGISLQYKAISGPKETTSEQSEKSGHNKKFDIEKRFYIFFLTFLLALGFCCWAGLLYEDRRLIGATLFCIGLAIYCSGLYLSIVY